MTGSENTIAKILSELAWAHKDKPIVVMGGATSLPFDLDKATGEVYISANQHGHLIRPADYICSIDGRHQSLGIPMEQAINPVKDDAVTISPAFWADVRVNDIPRPNRIGFPMSSGVLALFAAAVMGGNPVIAMGFDWYQSGTYHHNAKAKSSSLGRPMSFFERQFGWLVKNCQGVDFQAVSGPLQEVFGQPEGSREWIDRYARHKPHKVQWTGIPAPIYHDLPTQGEHYWLSRDEMVRFNSRITDCG